MRKLRFICGKIIKEMQIDYIKVIKGNDFHLKYLLYQTIRSCILNKKSEYTLEQCNKEFLIDNELCKFKSDQLFDVHPYFNLGDDLKMGTKSLSYKYLMSILSTNDYFESINTINLLFQSLQNELNNSDDNYKFEINELNDQLLCKILKPFYLINDYETNMYDFNYEDMIIYQLKLIEQIINISHKEYILLLNIHKLTHNILDILLSFKHTIIIVFAVETEYLDDIKMMYLSDAGGIDCCEINDLYTLICEKSAQLWTEEELKLNLIKYFNNINCDETRLIAQQLKHR